MAQTMPAVAGLDISSTSTTALFEPGTYVEQSGSTYVYIKSHAALVIGTVYPYLESTGVTSAALTTAIAASPLSLCIPQITFSAANLYGWALCGPGNGNVLVLTLCAADVPLYSATGGLDDTATKLVHGIKITTTNSTGGTLIEPCQLSCKLFCSGT